MSESVQSPSPAIPPRGRRVPPASPGPAAGFPIGPSERQRLQTGLPPGIPAAAAGVIVTSGTAPTQPATAALHPSFAPLPAQTVEVRQQAEVLRSLMRTLVTTGQNGVRGIDSALAVFSKADPALLSAEGLDIALIRSFRASIQSALDIAAPPAPAPTPAPAADS